MPGLKMTAFFIWGGVLEEHFVRLSGGTLGKKLGGNPQQWEKGEPSMGTFPSEGRNQFRLKQSAVKRVCNAHKKEKKSEEAYFSSKKVDKNGRRGP